MIIGIFIGLAFGITLTTVMWSLMLMRGGKRRAENDKKVEALLYRKAEGIERIAMALESKNMRLFWTDSGLKNPCYRNSLNVLVRHLNNRRTMK